MRAILLFVARVATGAIVALLAANALASATGLRWLGIENQEHLHVVNQFAAGERAADAVFYGTSVTRNAAVPLIVEERLREILGRDARVWNLALPGSTPEVARFYAEELFRRERPRIFVLEGAPFLWNAYRVDNQGGQTFWRWFSDPMDVLRRLPHLRPQYVEVAVKGWNYGMEALWNVPFYLGRRAAMDAARLEKPRGGNYDVAMLAEGHQPELDERDLQRGIRRIRPLRHSEAWRRELMAVGAACREQGIGLIVVNLPLHERIQAEFAPGAYDRHLQWISENTRAAGGVFVDLNGDPEWRWEDEDFRDYVHYSPHGARRFSRRFAEEVLAPLLPR